MRKYFDTVTNRNTGKVVPNATVSVLDDNGDPITIYTDSSFGGAATSVLSDENGLYSFFAPDDTYTIRQEYGSVVIDIPNVEIYDDAEDRAKTARAILVPEGETGPILPAIATRAGKFFVFDAIGQPTTSEGTGADAGLRTALADSSGAALVGFLQSGTGAVARTAQDKMRDTVSVKDFGAVGDGTTNDYAAVAAAVTSLPSTGGTVIFPDSAGYKLDTTVTDGGKPVHFVLGGGTITGPSSGFIFDLQHNGSTIDGAGRGQTILKLTTPASAPTMPTATATLTADVVTSVAINTAGTNLASTPICVVGASPTEADAALIPTISGGGLTLLTVLVGGTGYVGAPAISFIGGGAGAIKSNEILAGRIRGISIDMSSIANACGLYMYGGWYNDWADIDIISTSVHASAVPIVIDSHTLGAPGSTGSYGGAYVNYFRNIYASKVYAVGHDTSTVTTLQFDTLDALNILLHACIAVTFVNPVVQSSGGVFFDLVNVDGMTCFGGDIEGSSTLIRSRGSCNNIRFFGPLAYSFTGTTKYGVLGTGWEINLAKSNSTTEPLRTGSGGAGGIAYQNTGWNVKHRLGINWSGDTMVYGSNIKLTSATAGTLDDINLGATVAYMDTNGQFVIKYATAGANPRTLVGIGQFGTTGIGYITGAGGAVTQATSKSTGVTLNTASGAITMHNATLNATTSVGFTLTNSMIAATDTVLVSIKSGATADSYVVTVDAVAGGSCRLSLRNISGGSLAEAVVLNFAVFKAVTA